MIRIAIIEDNQLSRRILEEKISAFSDLAIVMTAENGLDAISKVKHNPEIDLVFMDVEMPVMNGIEATAVIKKIFPKIKIVMITIYDDDDHIFRAIKSGADGYILKDTNAEKIYETVSDTVNGGAVMSPSIAVKTLKLLQMIPVIDKSSNPAILSARETEILENLSKGFTNKLISEKLFISPFTVKRHIENIYQKLQAHNRTELLENARKKNLL